MQKIKLLLYFFFFSFALFGQVPVNDNCSGAISIVPSKSCEAVSGSMVGVTGPSYDVWYYFVATSTSHAIGVTKTKDLNSQTRIFKPEVKLFTDCTGATQLTSEKLDNSTQSVLQQDHNERTFTNLTIGNKYYYTVSNIGSGYYNFEFDTYVCDYVNLGNVNDEVATAVNLPINPFCQLQTFNMSKSTKSATTIPLSATTGITLLTDVWFKVTVPASGRVSLIVETQGIRTGIAMGLYKGTNSSNLVEVGSDCLGCLASSTTLSLDKSGLTPNDVLYVRIAATGGGTVYGTFKICASSPPTCGNHTPAGDLCANATHICDLNGYCGNTSASYGADKPGNLSSVLSAISIDNNSWLSFTADSTDASFTVFVSNCVQVGSANGIQIQVFDAVNCTNFVPKSSLWSPGTIDNSVIYASNLTPGNEYLIFIDGANGAHCDYTISTNSGIQLVDAGPDQTYCNPNTNPLQLNATGTGVSSLKWSSRAGGVYTPNIGSTASLAVNPGPTVDTRYIVEATSTCTGTKDSLLVTMKNCLCVQPTINTQPRDTSVCSGSTVTYKVATTGATSFQWKESKNGGLTYSDVTNGGIYSGATTNTLILTNVSTTNSTNKYKCIIKDITGKCSDSTVIVNLTVNPLPTATISTTATVCQNDVNPVVTLTGASGKSTYIFTYSLNGGVNSTITSTGNTATISVPTTSVLTNTYTLVSVKDANGCSQNQTGNVIIKVDATNVGGTVSTNHTVCSGSPSNLLTLTGNTGAITKWQYSVSPYTTWKDTAITTSTFTSGPLIQSTKFRAVVKSGACPEAYANPVLVTVDPKSIAGTLSASKTICSGNTSGLLTLTGNGNVIQKWQSAIKPYTSWTDISNSTTAYTSGVLTDTTKYRVLVKSGVCPTDTSNQITIAVNPNQALNLQCGNSSNTSVQFTWDKIIGASSYIYSYTVDNVGPAITGTISKDSISTTISVSGMGKTVNFTLTPEGVLCTGPETANCISKTCPKPTTDQLLDITVCAGDNIDIPVFTSPDSPESFSWTNSNIAIGLPLKGITDTLFKTALVTKQEVGIIKVNAYKNPCKGPTMTFKITVNPLPIVTTKSDTSICKGASVTLKGLGASSYSWDNGISNNNPFAPTVTNTYKVTGTDLNSCKNTASVTVTVNPLPVFSAINTGPICENDTLFKLNQTGSTLTSWSWKSNLNSVFSDSLIQNPTVKKGVNGEIFTLKGKDANGCVSSASTTLTINSQPAFSVSANSPCEKQTLNLNCSLAGATTYAWSHKNGFSNSSQNPTIPSSSLSDSGYYKLTVTNINGCSKSDSVFVKINPTPVFTPTAISPCETKTFSVKANFSNAKSYAWSGPVALASTETVEVSKNASPTTHDGTYTVIVTDNNNCSDTKSVVVTVKTSPIISASNDGPKCANDTLFTLDQAGATLTKWSWKSNLIAVFSDSLQKNPSVKKASDGEVFTLTGTDANGCSSIVSTTIKIFPIPVFTPSANSPCENLALNLTASISNAKAYSWSNVNGFQSTNENPVITPCSLADSGTYVLKVTDNNNCSDTKKVKVVIHSNPVFTPSYTPLCETSPLILKANYNSITPVKKYKWVGPQTLKDSIPSIPITTVTKKADPLIHNGEYSLTILDNNTCSTTKKIAVTINSLPIVQTSNNLEICLGDSVALKGSGALTYTWNNAISDNVFFKPTSTTSYIVKGIDANKCENSDTVTIGVNLLPSFTVKEMCVGASQTLVANHPSATTNAWVSANTNVLTVNAVSGMVNALTAGNVGVTFKDDKGCQFSKVITINPAPTITNIPFEVCDKNKITAVSNHKPALQNPWKSTGNFTVINLISGEIIANGKGSDSISFTDIKGCKTQKLITVLGLPNVDFTSKTSICEDDTLLLIDLSSPKSVKQIWSYGNGKVDTSSNYVYTKGGKFDIKLTSISSNGCRDSITKVNYLEVVAKPTVLFSFAPDSIDILEPLIYFENLSNAKHYHWNFGDGKPTSTNSKTTHLFPEIPGQYYTVTLTGYNTDDGCSNSYSQVLVAKEPVIYYVPNSFTPNGDELNNTFQPVFYSGMDPYNYSFTIYNRWGELIFESHNSKIGWDGSYNNQIAPNDTYVWKLEFKEKQTDKQHLKTGHVNLIK